jgi:hypothetical protein
MEWSFIMRCEKSLTPQTFNQVSMAQKFHVHFHVPCFRIPAVHFHVRLNGRRSRPARDPSRESAATCTLRPRLARPDGRTRGRSYASPRLQHILWFLCLPLPIDLHLNEHLLLCQSIWFKKLAKAIINQKQAFI